MSAQPKTVAGALVYEVIAEAPGAALLDTSRGAMLWLPGRRREERDEELLRERLGSGVRSWAWVLGRAPGLAVRLSREADAARVAATELGAAFSARLELGEGTEAMLRAACARVLGRDEAAAHREPAEDPGETVWPDEAVEVPLLAEPEDRPAPVRSLTTPRPRRRLGVRILLWGLASMSILAVVIALTLLTNPAARALVRGFPWRARLKRMVKAPVHVPDLMRLELQIDSGVLTGVKGPPQHPGRWALCDQDFLCLDLARSAGRFKAALHDHVTLIGVMPAPVLRWPDTGRVVLDWDRKAWVWHQVDHDGSRWPIARRVVTPEDLADFAELVTDSPPWRRPLAVTFWSWSEPMRETLRGVLKLHPGLRVMVTHGRPRSVVRGVWSTEAVDYIIALDQRVENLDEYAGDPGAIQLVLWGSRTSDISKLGPCKRLRVLDLSDTKVKDIAPLSRCRELEVLGLQGTPVEDLEPLAGLPNLRKLYLGGTKVRDISPLTSCPALRDLELAQTDVDDLRPLLDMPALEWAYVRGVPAEIPPELKDKKKPRVLGEPQGREAPEPP